jgi:aryl-alcohol dehydrogenase-like predicted oxidoreductase
MTSTYSMAGREINRVGYGTMQLPGPGVFGPPKDHDQAIAVLRRARELGVDHFDTSAYYGPWVSNDLLREALHPYDGMTIVSKVGGRRGPDKSWIAAGTPAELLWGIDENLIGLDVEHIDVMNLRLMENGDPAFDEKLGTMADAVQAGKIGAIGLSNVTLTELDRAAELGIDVACVQNRYSLTFRKDEALLEACTERGIAFAPFFPLDFGKVTATDVVGSIAARLGATPAQVGLAWLLAHAPNLLVIAGTSSLAHLEENVAVGDLELTAEDVAALGAA